MIAPTAVPHRYQTRRRRTVYIRPALAADRPALAAMIAELSAQTVERRYFIPRALPHAAAWRESERLTRADAARHVLLATLGEGAGRIVAVAELVNYPAPAAVAESAVVVTDAFQGEGIGRVLAERLGEHARAAALATIQATVRADNTPVRRLIASLGRPYSIRYWCGELQIEIAVAAPPAPQPFPPHTRA